MQQKSINIKKKSQKSKVFLYCWTKNIDKIAVGVEAITRLYTADVDDMPVVVDDLIKN